MVLCRTVSSLLLFVGFLLCLELAAQSQESVAGVVLPSDSSTWPRAAVPRGRIRGLRGGGRGRP